MASEDRCRSVEGQVKTPCLRSTGLDFREQRVGLEREVVLVIERGGGIGQGERRGRCGRRFCGGFQHRETGAGSRGKPEHIGSDHRPATLPAAVAWTREGRTDGWTKRVIRIGAAVHAARMDARRATGENQAGCPSQRTPVCGEGIGGGGFESLFGRTRRWVAAKMGVSTGVLVELIQADGLHAHRNL